MATDNIEDQLDKAEFKPEIMKVESQVPDAVVDQIEAEQKGIEEPDELTPEEPMLVKTKKHRRSFLKSRKFWVGLIILLLISAALAWLITPSRIWLVNKAGLKATLVMTTLGEAAPSQAAPALKNTLVKVNGTSYYTNEKGAVTISRPYGTVDISISKPGYTEVAKTFKLDFDPFFYKLGGKAEDDALRHQSVTLKSVGLPLTFQATNWLTGEPLAEGEFTIGDAVAKPNDQGVVSITMPSTDARAVSVVAKFGGSYIDKTFKVAIQADPLQSITFVPAGTHYFTSRQNGVLSVYRSDLDGGNKAAFITGTAHDTSVLRFSVSPNAKYAAMVSTRDGQRSDRGLLQPKLYLVELATKRLTVVEAADWFKIADWSGDSVVYTLSGDGKQRLVSVDAVSGKRTELASGQIMSNVFVGLNGARYTLAGTGETPQLFSVGVKGGTPVSLGSQVQALTQPDAEVIAFRTADGLWHEYNTNTGKSKHTSPPASASRHFLNGLSQNGQYRLYLDKNAGIPTLVASSVANGKEEVLALHSGLQGPVRWVGNNAVYRKIDKTGAADYVVSARGGEAKKITPVTADAADEQGFN